MRLAGVGEPVTTLYSFGREGDSSGTQPERGGPSTLKEQLAYIVKKQTAPKSI